MDDLTMDLILTKEVQHSLTRQVTREEVTYALTQMHPFKTSGPYGFQSFFFKHFWHIVGDDVV